jgi:hypothetical protein
MPIASPEQYAAMLDVASAGGYALADVNVTSSKTRNGAIHGLAEARAVGPARADSWRPGGSRPGRTS